MSSVFLVGKLGGCTQDIGFLTVAECVGFDPLMFFPTAADPMSDGESDLMRTSVFLSLLMVIALLASAGFAGNFADEGCSISGGLHVLRTWAQDMEQAVLPLAQEREAMHKLARIAHHYAGRRSLGRCAHWVVEDLTRARIIRPADHPWGANGWQVGPALEKEGKVVKIPIDPKTNLPVGCKSLYDVPPGTLLAYKRIPGTAKPGQCKTCGHIEIRTLRGFASDYRSETPITGSEGLAKGPPGHPTHILVGAYIPAD